jgi:hypothetical protein
MTKYTTTYLKLFTCLSALLPMSLTASDSSQEVIEHFTALGFAQNDITDQMVREFYSQKDQEPRARDNQRPSASPSSSRSVMESIGEQPENNAPQQLPLGAASATPVASADIAANLADQIRNQIIPGYLNNELTDDAVQSFFNNNVWRRQDQIDLFTNIDTPAKAFVVIAAKSLGGGAIDEGIDKNDLLKRLQSLTLEQLSVPIVLDSETGFKALATMMYRTGLWPASFAGEDVVRESQQMETAQVEPAQGSSQKASETVPLSEIDRQIARVKAFSEQARGPVNLLLGAVNTKAVHGNWVYLDNEELIYLDDGTTDINQHDRTSEGRPYIKGSFNDLDLLEKLANDLESCFDEILLDDSTFKFITEWNTQKLACFAKMLKPDGTFVFCPEPGGIRSLYETIPADVTAYHSHLNELREATARINRGGVAPGDCLEGSSFKLITRSMMRQPNVKVPEAQNPYYRLGMLPYNQALLSRVFGEVSLEKHQGFPIQSKWTTQEQEIDLFVCRKSAAPAAAPVPQAASAPQTATALPNARGASVRQPTRSRSPRLEEKRYQEPQEPTELKRQTLFPAHF